MSAQTVLITGPLSGIGRATALAYARQPLSGSSPAAGRRRALQQLAN